MHFDGSFLTNSDIVELCAWRQELHANPELSGEEQATARRVVDFLAPTAPDHILTGLGGHGVAAIYQGAEAGPTVLLRCELDALPIEELSGHSYASTVPGKAHLCGHDGHMAILAGVGRALCRQRPARGRVVLLFQPAEETGAGAAAVIADPRFCEIAPDYAFSLHNMPGLPIGQVSLAEGPVNCASRGMKTILTGKTAHASEPERGTSPMAALARLMPALTALGSGGDETDGDFALVTVTHARLGEPAFGIAPGAAELRATLRTLTDSLMADLVARAEALVAAEAERAGLALDLSYEEVFRACENDPEAAAILRRALDAEGIIHGTQGLPMRASEDFGRFGDHARAAMLFLGAGVDQPGLHNPDYDFPDALIPIGGRIFLRAVHHLLG